MPMSLRHMEVFHAVYMNGTVVAAAKALNVSQPSISKVLAHAEIRLGFQLFRRVRGRLIATDEADVLFREINDLQSRLSSVRQTARNLRGGVGGYLRLAFLPSLGLEVAPLAVARMLAARPSLNVNVQCMHHDDILHALIGRDSELAVGFDPPNHPRLESRQIGQGELVAFFRKEAMPAPPERISLGALDGDTLISLANSGPVGELFSNETAAANLSFVEQVAVRTYYVAAGLVKAGVGVAVIDQFTARALKTEALDYRPLDPPVVFGLHAIYLADRPPSRLADQLLSLMTEVLSEQAL